MRTHRLRTPSNDNGFSLLELLVAMVLAIVVVGVPLTLVVDVFTHETRVQDVTVSQRTLERGVERMEIDLRHATAATVASATLTLTVPVSVPSRTSGATATPPASTQVVWSCTANATAAGGSCTRTYGGGAAESVIARVTGVTFAAYRGSTATALALPQADPPYVTIAISAQPRISATRDGVRADATPVSYSAGISLRNFG